MPDASATTVRAHARVQAEGDGFRLELRIEDGARVESRSVFSRDCDALARATGLVVAVAIDPVEVARRIGEPAVAETTTPPEPAPLPDPAVLPPAPAPQVDRVGSSASAAHAPPPRDRTHDRTHDRTDDRTRDRTGRLPVRLGARPELLVGGGLLPGPVSLGVAGTASAFGRKRPWRAEIAGAYWFARRATIVGAPSAGGEIWLAYARGSGCWVPGVRRIEIPICGGVDLGAAGGRGFGEGVDTRSNTDLFVGSHAGVGVMWAPIPALALFARVEGVVALRRPGFRIDGVGDEAVHRIGAAGASGAVGLEVRFSR